jgi:glycosyltransferase involved in cell wall biosynthesis
MVHTDQGYLLSAGKTGRDYATLADAVRGLPYKIVVVSDPESIKGIDFPPNCELLVNISRERYLLLLNDCRIVLVPLHRLIKSTGQVVFLEAMALGKPVVATETVGTFDYIQSGQNGLLVPPYDSHALKEAIINVAGNKTVRNDFGRKGLEFVIRNCTFQNYVETVLKAADEVCGKDRPMSHGDKY